MSKKDSVFGHFSHRTTSTITEPYTLLKNAQGTNKERKLRKKKLKGKIRK